ncbi:MAG: iron-sulfur cluster assembly accessory protein [Acidobacteriota bacterium]
MAIQVTEAAARQIRRMLEKEGMPGGGLRLGVRGGGCSGLNYVVRYEASPRPMDKVFEQFGAKVFVDLKSLLYLHGLILDWHEDFMKQGFVFRNPNAKRTCSCGTSFSL